MEMTVLEQIEYKPSLAQSKPLALSLHARYLQDKKLLSKPITTLARMRGVNVSQVYDVLLPSLVQKDLGEALRFAETGLKYAAVVDRNRLREEIGESFIVSMDIIISLIEEGLTSKDNWIKRKSIAMHGELIDETAEKSRFIESLLVEQKMEMVAKSVGAISQIEEEVISFEEKLNGTFEMKEICS
jgi:hypothetical protein